MLKDDYPALWHFLGAYLHQDWRDEYGDTSEAFQDFLESEPALAALIVPEMDAVLALHSPDEVERLAIDLGSSYRPSRPGQDAREWMVLLRASAQDFSGTA